MKKAKKTSYPFYVKGSNKKVTVKAGNYSEALDKALSVTPSKFLETKYAKNMNLVTATSKAKLASKKSAHKQYVVLTETKDFDVETQFGLTSKMEMFDIYYKGEKLDKEARLKEIERVQQYIKSNKPETPEVMKKAISKVENKVKAPKLNAEQMKVVKADEARRAKELASTPEARKKAAKDKEIADKAAAKLAIIEAKKQAAADKAAKSKDKPKAGKEPKGDKVTVTKVGKITVTMVGKNKIIEGAKMVTLSTNEMLAKIAKGYRYFTEEGKSKAESVLQGRGDKDAKHKMQELLVK